MGNPGAVGEVLFLGREGEGLEVIPILSAKAIDSGVFDIVHCIYKPPTVQKVMKVLGRRGTNEITCSVVGIHWAGAY
jgi:hypothetical protein